MEVPEFKRCCCCLPLRRGLITWGYGKIILDLLLIWINYYEMMRFNRGRFRDYSAAIWILVFAVDLLFSVMSIIGAHKKMYKLLRVYLYYSIVWMSLVLIFFCYVIYMYVAAAYLFEKNVLYYRLLRIIITSFAATFVQVYVILLLRSEINKLRRESQPVQFTNNAAEAGALNIALQYKGNHANDNTDRAVINDNNN